MLTVGRFGTSDLDRAGKFYDAIAGLLDAARIFQRDDLIAYKSAEGGMFIIGRPFEGEASVGNGSQMGFGAASRAVVDTVHAKAIELGAQCEGKPGVRGVDPEDPNGFYGAYFRDPDGNKITVFRMGQ